MSTSIPDDQVRWGSFPILREDNLDRLRTLCENNKDKVGKLYSIALRVPSCVSPIATSLMETVVSEVTDVPSIFCLCGTSFHLGYWIHRGRYRGFPPLRIA